jgi:transcriptional regulator with XRE-family HTH domain
MPHTTIPKPPELRQAAIGLVCMGLSQRQVARIFKVSPNTISRWYRCFGLEARHEMENRSCAHVEQIEIDEMHHYTVLKKTSAGCGKPWIRIRVDYWPAWWAAVAVKASGSSLRS